jgi:hypothetical protein
MHPDNADAKTGENAGELLESKQPESRVPDISVMEKKRGTLPGCVELDVTADAVKKVARPLEAAQDWEGPTHQTCNIGSFDLGGSSEFRKAVAESVRWKGDNNPPWAAHRALWAGQLVAADKMP